MGNGNQVFHRICLFLDPKHLKNHRFGGIFLKFRIFNQINFKTIDFAYSFFVGRSGRSVGGSWIRKKSENSTRIYLFQPQFECTILVTVNFKLELLASLATYNIIYLMRKVRNLSRRWMFRRRCLLVHARVPFLQIMERAREGFQAAPHWGGGW